MSANPTLLSTSTVEAGLIDFGLTPAAFRAKYFEKNYLLLRGALRMEFAWREVDEILRRVDPLPPHFQLYKDCEVPLAEYIAESRENGVSRPCLSKARIYEHLRNGASAVINRAESLSSSARHLCHDVARFVGQPTIGNTYLSFSGRGTFGKHWDTHDVFVLQLLGNKRWQVFAPTWRLPLVGQKSTGLEHQCEGLPVLDCELHPGDVLYLPRGWWHQAMPLQQGSFHLSVGTYAPTALEFVQWACQRQLSMFAGARVGLTGGSQVLDVDGIVAELARALRDPQALVAFHRSRHDERTETGEFDVRSLVDEALTDDSTVHLTSCYAPALNGAKLIFNASELRLDPLRQAVVMQLDRTQGVTMRDLYACLTPASPASVRSAIHDLAQHDVVTIRRS